MDASVPTAGRVEVPAAADWASELVAARQTVLPRRLVAPGPDEAQLNQILGAAASAPDHGERMPWRFVIVPPAGRPRLGEVFAQALLQRDPSATPQQVAQARDKAARSPCLMLAIAALGPANEEIPAAERLVSAGCAIQNVLLVATAMEFGSSLTSGKALVSQGLRALFGLCPHEQALCFISIGTASSRKPRRARPSIQDYVSRLKCP